MDEFSMSEGDERVFDGNDSDGGERAAGLTAIHIAKGVNLGAPATKVCTRLILNVNLHRICMRHRAYPRLTRSTPGLNTSLIAVYTCATAYIHAAMGVSGRTRVKPRNTPIDSRIRIS